MSRWRFRSPERLGIGRLEHGWPPTAASVTRGGGTADTRPVAKIQARRRIVGHDLHDEIEATVRDSSLADEVRVAGAARRAPPLRPAQRACTEPRSVLSRFVRRGQIFAAQ